MAAQSIKLAPRPPSVGQVRAAKDTEKPLYSGQSRLRRVRRIFGGILLVSLVTLLVSRGVLTLTMAGDPSPFDPNDPNGPTETIVIARVRPGMGAIVRSDPNGEAVTIRRLPPGTAMRVLDEADRYYRIRSSDDTVGWVLKLSLETSDDTPDPNSPSDYRASDKLSAALLVSVVSLVTSLSSLVGFGSTTVLAWRREGREKTAASLDLEKKQLEIEKLRQELEKKKEANDQPA